MPNYQVVRCAEDKCARFQTQQEKKTKKWSCVVCGLKQSLKRVYFESTASKDCRPVVMEMNMKSGQANQVKQQMMSCLPSLPSSSQMVQSQEQNTNSDIPRSKWNRYLDDANEPDDVATDDQQLDKSGRITLGPAPSKEVKSCRLTAAKRTVDVSGARTSLTVRSKPYERPAAPIAANTSLSAALADLRQNKQPVASTRSTTQTSVPAQPAPKISHESSRWDQYISESESDSSSE